MLEGVEHALRKKMAPLRDSCGSCGSREQLRLGWGSWREMNTRARDMNFAFSTAGTEALQSMLRGEEARSLKCVWREDLGDDWGVYLRTYAAGIYHLLLRCPPRTSAFSCHKYRPRQDK
jgi:hypothetical protein